MLIGDTIRTLRGERGMTREELAEAVGISPAAVEHYEANTWRPGLPVIIKLADHFGVTVTDILKNCSAFRDEATGDIVLVQDVGKKCVKVFGAIKNTLICNNRMESLNPD